MSTPDAKFCIAALEEAIALYGIPAIFNTDQGCQFTSDAFIAVLESNGIQISMDGEIGLWTIFTSSGSECVLTEGLSTYLRTRRIGCP